MLEAKDLEMITEIVTRAVEKSTSVMREHIGELRQDVKDLRQDVTELQQDVKDLRQDVTELQRDVKDLRQDVTELQRDVKDLRQDVTELQRDVKDLRQDVTGLQRRTETMEEKISAIKVTQENEVLKGVCIVGEGHLDLSRKLTEILETKEERELMKLRVQYLEREIRRIKDHLEIA